MFICRERWSVADKFFQIPYGQVRRYEIASHFFQVKDTKINLAIPFYFHHNVIAAEAVVLQMVTVYQPHCIGKATQNIVPKRRREGRILKQIVERVVTLQRNRRQHGL